MSGEIVVGADGSERADRALRWAVQEAKLRDARLRIVTAWHVPLAVYARPASAPPASASLQDEVRQAAEAVAASAAAEARKEGGVAVETAVVEGDAADVLVDAARDADLLVLGSARRSHTGLLTGSVSVQCALNAPVPTAIVH